MLRVVVKMFSSLRQTSALLLVLVSLSSSAKAEEFLVCSFKGWKTDKIISIKYAVVKDQLIEVATVPSDFFFNEQYKILQNNTIGLVAIREYSEIGPDKSTPTIGLYGIIIDRKKGSYQRFGAFYGSEPTATHGSCVIQ